MIDLNADVGETFGIYRLGKEEELIPHLTSVNVAKLIRGQAPRVWPAAVSPRGYRP